MVASDFMTIKAICQELKSIPNIRPMPGPTLLLGALAGLAFSLLPGCVLIRSKTYPPPICMAAIQDGIPGDQFQAGLWAALLSGLLLAGLAAYALRRLSGFAKPGAELDREDLALLRTARDALSLFNRKKRGFGMQQLKRPRDRL